MSALENVNITEKTVVVIGGPTASGKSGLALEVAKKYNGVVINADAMQVYQSIPIITAVPSPEDKKQVLHLLYEIYPPSQRGNVADWLNKATTAIRDTWAEKKLPVVVGGTGFYIESLIKGVSPIPETNSEVKQQVADIIGQKGADGAYDYLQKIDASGAQMVKPQDTTRIRRALEIKLDTGQSISEWFQKPLVKTLPEADFAMIKLLPSLSELEEKCSRRFDIMMEQGALDEVKNLLNRHLSDDLPAMKAIGVPELGDYIRGKTDLNQAVALAKLHTRQYAKRQLTWFRNR
ncbi:MAG: tRNA (adenosine(37)-N6)-dimethylallyltransferase MiaA [Alphaproteobacteria bacterium]|nr:tRNA (adenosine(37)-N6)-dimethylallyltransferase MiaA [Alphaproteobacteria bacterium]